MGLLCMSGFLMAIGLLCRWTLPLRVNIYQGCVVLLLQSEVWQRRQTSSSISVCREASSYIKWRWFVTDQIGTQFYYFSGKSIFYSIVFDLSSRIAIFSYIGLIFPLSFSVSYYTSLSSVTFVDLLFSDVSSSRVWATFPFSVASLCSDYLTE